MQAHKAHPIQFEDDCKRDSSGSIRIRTNMDLEKIVRDDIIYKQSRGINQSIICFLKHEDSEKEHDAYWANNMGYQEPYCLSKENLMESSQKSSAEITCIVCLINIEVKW